MNGVSPAILVSATACVVGLLFAFTTLFLSTAPNTRGLRVFSASCLFGALYAATNVTILSGYPEVARAGLRVALLFAGLHGASWYVFVAARHGRRLYGWERAIVVGGVVFGLLSVVPGLLYEDRVWEHDVTWLGAHYIDQKSRLLGDVAFGYYSVAMGILLVRSVRRFRAADAAERAETIGLGILLATGVNDSLVSSGALDAPYLLDLGFLTLVVLVGSALARSFVDNARALEEAQEELVRRELLAALGEMSAVVAHEVRNPVAIIFNAVGQLRKAPAQREELLSIVEDEAERLKRMVSDLLEFARPANVVLAETALAPVVESAIAAVRGSVDAAPVEVEVDLDGCPERVDCDERLIRQALINLMTNAVQASTKAGRVKVSARAQGDRVSIVVADNGVGIPDALEAKIFTPFFTTRPTGTGLGLPVVQRIAEAHGGALAYRPTPGGGATFELSLPRSRS